MVLDFHVCVFMVLIRIILDYCEQKSMFQNEVLHPPNYLVCMEPLLLIYTSSGIKRLVRNGICSAPNRATGNVTALPSIYEVTGMSSFNKLIPSWWLSTDLPFQTWSFLNLLLVSFALAEIRFYQGCVCVGRETNSCKEISVFSPGT